jgi:hypothetical protein
MGSSRQQKARAATKLAGGRASGQHRGGPPKLTKTPTMPAEIEDVIEEQRRELVTAITLVHCLHSVLRRQKYDNAEECPAVELAEHWVELPDMSAMLLARLHSVHLALDSVSLRQAAQAPPRGPRPAHSVRAPVPQRSGRCGPASPNARPLGYAPR